jgi:hypothetical protein
MGSKPDKVKAPTADYAADIGKFVQAYGASLPQVLAFEKQFRPEFQALNLQDISNFLGGVGGQEGLFGLSRMATQEAGKQLSAARESELGSMAGQAPLTRGVMEGLSPEQAAVVSGFAQEAQRAQAAAQGVSPEQQRMYQQQARQAAQASGRVGGNAAVASEIMGREQMMAQKRAEAIGAGQNLFSAAGQFYTQPGLALLSQQPLSYQTGQGMLGMGMGGIKQGTPGLINPDMGLNLGAAERQNRLQAQMANAQAQASYGSGLMGMGGDAIVAAGTVKAAMLCIPSGETIDTVDGKKLIDDITPNDKVIGFSGDEVTVLQKHSYKENPETKRFLKIKFDDGSTISLCDKHKVSNIESQNIKVGDCFNKKTVVLIDYFDGVEISYDLLTSDDGYQMNGIPINSMILELIDQIIEIRNKQ